MMPMAPWTNDSILEIYQKPLPHLVFEAQEIHRHHHDPTQVQFCTLSNIKSGNCPEDCAYCPQSARYNTGIDKYTLPSLDEIRQQAEAAKAGGSTRLCMGAAWREVRDGRDFQQVLEMVRLVRSMDMEACVTLGMLSPDQARQLKEAGLTAYNHNIDTSPEYYSQIITTRTFEDRLRTIENVRQAGIQVCCGGIVGLGETLNDRIGFLQALANLDPPPESVPINALVPVEGTPLGEQPPIDSFDLVRTVATARILMPQSTIRLSAGRTQLTDEAQALCFLAGANSIFTGEKLLTTPNPGTSHDEQLLHRLGMTPMPGHGARQTAEACL
jgi:biotin synthase